MSQSLNQQREQLLEFLNACQENFEESHRIAFKDTSEGSKFCGPTHIGYDTKPHILGAYPGTSPHDGGGWVKYCMTVQVKVGSDPLVQEEDMQKCRDYTRSAIAKVVKDATNLLYSSASNYVFVLGVYTNSMRIFRFDHSGSVSCAFDYQTNPEILRAFFWRLVHPSHKIPHSVVGWDETVLIPTQVEVGHMKDKILQWNRTVAENYEISPDTCRCVRVRVKTDLKLSGGIMADGDIDIVPHIDSVERNASCTSRYANKGASTDEQSGERDVEDDESEYLDIYGFTFGRPLHKSSHLVSRATYVARMMILIDGYWHAVAAKDSWRESDRRTERLFYKRIERRFPDLFDSPQFEWIKEIYGKEKDTIPGVADYYGYLDLSELVDLSGTARERGHTTFSPKGNMKAERNRCRILTGLGDNILDFKSTKELVTWLRDAIVGHYVARCLGILHRDISVGNILVKRGANGSQGFLHDFDYASFTDYDLLIKSVEIVDEDVEFKTLTGTRRFMAYDIFDGEPHDTYHDLESFFWVLNWTLLRHRPNNKDLKEEGKEKFSAKYFDQSSNLVASAVKSAWLVDRKVPLTVDNNIPLNALLGVLREIFSGRIKSGYTKAPPSHEEIVTAINTALECDDWPTDDGFVPLSRVENETTT